MSSSTDNRIKYFNSQVANLGLENVNPDDLDGFTDYESFEGGIHTENARMIFITFASIIMILHILAE